MPQLEEVEKGQLDSQLEMLKLISSLNHNINIEYEYPNRYEFEEILENGSWKGKFGLCFDSNPKRKSRFMED